VSGVTEIKHTLVTTPVPIVNTCHILVRGVWYGERERDRERERERERMAISI
jgi:hypothetical protein